MNTKINTLAKRLILSAGIAVVVGLSTPNSGAQQPVSGVTSMAGWHVQGPDNWRVQNGEIVGTVSQSGSGGLLVHDTAYQDIALKFSFRCTGECKPGVVLAMQDAGDRTNALYVSLAPDDVAGYEVVLDAQGNEIERNKPAEAASGGGPRGGGRAGGSARGALPFSRTNYPPPDGYPEATEPPGSVHSEGWNRIQLYVYFGAVKLEINGINANVGVGGRGLGFGTALPMGDRIGALEPAGLFGPFALRIAGGAGAEVRIKDFTISDLTQKSVEEKLSDRFVMRHLDSFHTADALGAGDLNRDGFVDLVAGPVYYLGPDFKIQRQIEITEPFNPNDFSRTIGLEVGDVNNDGWPDVLEQAMLTGSPIYLYINPKGERRRWSRYPVIPAAPAEHWELEDVTGDGIPEVIYGCDGYLIYAEADQSDVTKPWIQHRITEQGPWGDLYNHGFGMGDINGDGRNDAMTQWGWWERPAQLTDAPWPYHMVAFGRSRVGGENGGGPQMYAYDVNGDGINDVVTALRCHGYGLSWFEQKRDSGGNISFAEHVIMDWSGDPDLSQGGVTFTELHGLSLADVDGDGLKDIVTGKQLFSHYGYQDPDGDGEPVLYWYRLIRKGEQVEFVPHLIHNRSGIGRQVMALDLNGDGAIDIANQTRMGTFIMFGKKDGSDTVRTLSATGSGYR